ncbi:hypothetical protein DFR52_10917 [Hoeflea marina]|uniref:MFS transporter n=1 Tax=Hoeflea marina TaxID=274592 RepID=A0A317PDU7_9HYPH|nr:hypothetical protein [Hoeflea marina]PWV95622.1 hypothetical protein DFR52_10917 [Hoeflea marina]
MKRLLALQGLILAVFVLLGNGLRSISTTTVSVSQSEFASFLNISVEKTDVLIELLLGGAVIALAVAPFVLTVRNARKVAVIFAIITTICYAMVGITMLLDPALDVREIVVIASFAFSGFSVAFFAPLAQLAINGEEDPATRARLTTVWISAQPIAFLLTPQLVKYVAFDIGTGNYFLILAAMPMVFLLFIPFVFGRAEATAIASSAPPEAAPAWKRVLPLVIAILAFEAWTASNSFVGIASPISLAFLGLFILICVALYSRQKHLTRGAAAVPPLAVFLLGMLFVLEIPTTGFYDTAYLVRHLCSSDLIDNRATLAAASQILAVFGTGAVLVRNPNWGINMLALSLPLLLAGMVAIYFYPYQDINVSLFYVSKVLSSIGIGMATASVIGIVAGMAAQNRIIALAPAFIIMFGTEAGIEILEVVFQSSKLAGLETTHAYQAVFAVQIAAVLVAIGLMLRWTWSRGGLGHAVAEAAA